MDDENFSLSIKYADDLTLLALDREKLQLSTYELQQAWMKWFMNINFDKYIVLTPSVDNILIQREYIENVSNLTRPRKFYT